MKNANYNLYQPGSNCIGHICAGNRRILSRVYKPADKNIAKLKAASSSCEPEVVLSAPLDRIFSDYNKNALKEKQLKLMALNGTLSRFSAKFDELIALRDWQGLINLLNLWSTLAIGKPEAIDEKLREAFNNAHTDFDFSSALAIIRFRKDSCSKDNLQEKANLEKEVDRYASFISVLDDVDSPEPIPFDLLNYQMLAVHYFLEQNFSCLQDIINAGHLSVKEASSIISCITNLFKFIDAQKKVELAKLRGISRFPPYLFKYFVKKCINDGIFEIK